MSLTEKRSRIALHHGCESGRNVDLILDRKSHLNAVDAHDDTPLHRAIKSKYSDAAPLLMESGADPNKLERKSRIAIHYAVEVGPDVDLSLQQKSEPIVIDANGHTSLICALLSNNLEIAKMLIESGAVLNIGRFKEVADAQGLVPARLVLVTNGSDKSHKLTRGQTSFGDLHIFACAKSVNEWSV